METPVCKADGCTTQVSKRGRMCDVCREAKGGRTHPCADCGRPISVSVKRCDQHWMDAKAGVTHRRRHRPSAALRREVFERDNYTCQNPECGFRPETHGLDKTQFLVLGHIKSHASGGETTAGNLRVLCGTCNRKEWFLPNEQLSGGSASS